jgi:predicted membrane protein
MMEVDYEKRYGGLRALSTIFKILGVVMAVIAVLGGIAAFMLTFSSTDLFTSVGLDESSGIFIGVFCSIVFLVMGLLTAVAMYGYAELLMVWISIEDNTLRTVTLLEDVTKEEVK